MKITIACGRRDCGSAVQGQCRATRWFMRFVDFFHPDWLIVFAGPSYNIITGIREYNMELKINYLFEKIK
jgi:hypothetical protein